MGIFQKIRKLGERVPIVATVKRQFQAKNLGQSIRLATTSPSANIAYAIAPFSPLGKTAKMGGAARAIGGGFKKAYQSLMKPQQAATIAGKLKTVAATTGLAGGALALGEYGATGKFPDFSTRTIASFAGLQINPVAAILGMGKGYGGRIYNAVEEKLGAGIGEGKPFEVPEWMQNPPQIPEITYPDFGGFVYEDAGTTINFPPSPEVSPLSGGIAMPSLNVDLPSGQSELVWILMALMAGGGAGYLLGRRKRKKKSRKKKRRKN